MALLKRLSALVMSEEEEPEVVLSDAARARQEVLRNLLKTPAVMGDEEYEALLGEAYEMATALLEEGGDAKTSEEEAGSSSLGAREEAAGGRRENEGEGGEAAPHRRPGAKWDQIGFQATAPDREFRGGGMLGLHCLVFALREAPEICGQLIGGPFPFAAASINMTMVVARLCGVVRKGSADEDAVDPLADVGGGSRSVEARCDDLLAASHDGFFLVHCAALEALERARRDVEAGPMDFAACAAASRDEVAVLLAHQPKTGEALRDLAHRVPKRVSGYLIVTAVPDRDLEARLQRADQFPGSSAASSSSAAAAATRASKQNARKGGGGSAWFSSLSNAAKSGATTLKRGRRYYVSLSTGTARWFDPADVHSHSGPGAATSAAIPLAAPLGTLRLRPTMTVKFNRPSCTLSVYAPDGTLALAAVALDAKDMERWCVALTEHVALGGAGSSDRLARADDRRECLALETLASARFKVVETVGIYVRSAPDVAATRTGHALMPGDVVIALERHRVADERAGPRGRAFLRIALLDATSPTQSPPQADAASADGRPPRASPSRRESPEPIGFVMEHHPLTFDPIMVQVSSSGD